MRRSPVAGALLLAAASTVGASAVARPAQDRMAPGSPHTTNVVVGQPPPTSFVLESIDGEVVDLAAARGVRPLLLLFFRGTW